MDLKKTHQIQNVYYAESDPPDFINMIAICPTISKREISWKDTTRIRSFITASISTSPAEALTEGIDPESISVTTSDGMKLNLQLMTLPLYNEKVKDQVVGQISFDSDEDLINYYLNTDFYSY